MTARMSQRRGQPLLALTAIILCWITARIVLWDAHYGTAEVVPSAVALSPIAGPPASFRKFVLAPPAADRNSIVEKARTPSRNHGVTVGAHPAIPAAPLPLWERSRDKPALATVLSLGANHGRSSPAAADTQLRAASPAGEGLPSFPTPFASPAVTAAPGAERRWSADAWTLLRSGGGVASAGPSVATYGASQAGAVLRYRLWPGNAHRPTGYLRVSAALNGSGEREVALGLSVRPVGALPIFVAGEGRVSRLASRTVVRPAVMAVTELPPIALPIDRGAHARAEIYLQGGYVGGAGATPFIDGQLRIDRDVARLGPVEVRAGGGTWGGAQRGAGRLDLGPTVTLQAAQGSAAVRLGLDWRFRLMGDAEPASGPALTISAGF